VIGLARDKSFTENWWLNRVIGKVRTPKPTESVLSVEEEALIFNASMPGLDVKQLSDLRLISEQTGIDPKRILDHASQNPGSYKRWKNAAKIDRRARWERRLRSVSISKNFGNAQKIYVWLLFINLFAATSSLLWSDAVTMTLWKFEGILILGMMPYSWIVQRVLAATPCELSY